MLDMGFEREMNACLTLIKQRCPEKFYRAPDVFHSDGIKINFVSATLSPKVEALGAKLMKSHSKVGFELEAETEESQNMIGSIPK